MPIVPDFSDDKRILPRGEYRVVFDGKVVGIFGSLQEAQNFQSRLGQRGSHILHPNLRKDMTQDQINVAQMALDDWGKNDAWSKKG